MASAQVDTHFVGSPLPILSHGAEGARQNEEGQAIAPRQLVDKKVTMAEPRLPAIEALTLQDRKEPSPIILAKASSVDSEVVAEHAETADPKPLPQLTSAEVSSHNKPGDCWLIIERDIYDVTTFQHDHPGGAKILSGVAGKDATKKFDKYHRRAILEQERYKNLRVGTLTQGVATKGLTAVPTAQESDAAPKKRFFSKWRS